MNLHGPHPDLVVLGGSNFVASTANFGFSFEYTTGNNSNTVVESKNAPLNVSSNFKDICLEFENQIARKNPIKTANIGNKKLSIFFKN